MIDSTNDKATRWVPYGRDLWGYEWRLNPEGHRETRAIDLTTTEQPDVPLLLGDEIVDMAILLGICDGKQSFTGPQVLLLAQDIKKSIVALRSAHASV